MGFRGLGVQGSGFRVPRYRGLEAEGEGRGGKGERGGDGVLSKDSEHLL